MEDIPDDVDVQNSPGDVQSCNDLQLWTKLSHIIMLLTIIINILFVHFKQLKAICFAKLWSLQQDDFILGYFCM